MSWITFPKPNPKARIRLFCFPYAGGSSQIFRNWPSRFAPHAEVGLVQLSGRGSRIRETAYTSLFPLIEDMAAAFGAYTDLPFAFFGHSMGSLISFELARRLRRERQQEPIHLFVSGRSAPQLPDEEPPTHNLPEPEFLEELRRLNGTPKEALAYPELMQILIPILRADFSVCETYIYTEEPPLACPISAFGGIQDSDVSREDLEAWRRQTTASFTLRMFSGDHFFLHSAEEQLLTILAEEISHLPRKESTARPTRYADLATFEL